MGALGQDSGWITGLGAHSGNLALALITDSRNDSVLFWKVVSENQVEDVLDKAAKKLIHHKVVYAGSNLTDLLWIEHESYCIFWVPLARNETAADVFRAFGLERRVEGES